MSQPADPSDRPGEFELIARLTDALPLAEDVVRGVGDDAAILNWPAGQQVVVTCDAQVEDSHFRRVFSAPGEIGRKALAVNLSDVAAMGARPRFALVSLILRPDVDQDWLEAVYAGIRAQAEAFGVSIIGGNIAATTGPTCLDITVIGAVPTGTALRRDGGRSGDRVYVSGHLGAGAAGLATLQEDASEAPREAVAEVRSAYRDPVPRVALGEVLRESGAVTAMMDISDGFAADLYHICDESDVGALIEEQALPLAPATQAVAEALGHSAVDWALSGGDDYQLLFAVAPEREPALAGLPPEQRQRVHPVGWLTAPEAGVRLRHADGSSEVLRRRGWDHLRGHTS